MSFFHFEIFLLIELSFWIGFSLSKRRDSVYFSKKETQVSEIVQHRFFLISFFICIIFQVVYYTQQGFVVQMLSKLDKYVNAISGLAIFERCSFFLKIYCTLYSVKNFKSNNKIYRLWSYLFVGYLTITLVLSGSKGALLYLIYIYFYVQYFIKRIAISKKIIIICFISVVLIGFITLSINFIYLGETDYSLAFLTLFRRVIMYGDIYYECYVDDIIDQVTINHLLNDLLVPVLAPFRLMDYTDIQDLTPSIQVHNIIYPELIDVNVGPNNRNPFLFYVYFGPIFGALFSFIIGLFTSKVLFSSLMYIKKNIFSLTIYVGLSISVISFVTDFNLGVGNMITVVFGYLFYKVIIMAVIPK